jgi:hypothetical protein
MAVSSAVAVVAEKGSALNAAAHSMPLPARDRNSRRVFSCMIHNLLKFVKK